MLTQCHRKFYLCYIIWLAIGSVVVYFFYPETKGHTLESMAVVFDGDDAKVGGEGGTAKGMELLGTLHKEHGMDGKDDDVEGLYVEHAK